MGGWAMAAFGTEVLRGPVYDPAEQPVWFEAVAEITNISGPGGTTDTEDTTSHDQTESIEHVTATVLRLGELRVEVNYLPGTHRLLAEDWRKRTKRVWKLAFPDAGETVWTFAGIVTQAPSPEVTVSGVLTAELVIKVTDDIDFGGHEGPTLTMMRVATEEDEES